MSSKRSYDFKNLPSDMDLWGLLIRLLSIFLYKFILYQFHYPMMISLGIEGTAHSIGVGSDQQANDYVIEYMLDFDPPGGPVKGGLPSAAVVIY